MQKLFIKQIGDTVQNGGQRATIEFEIGLRNNLLSPNQTRKMCPIVCIPVPKDSWPPFRQNSYP